MCFLNNEVCLGNVCVKCFERVVYFFWYEMFSNLCNE